METLRHPPFPSSSSHLLLSFLAPEPPSYHSSFGPSSRLLPSLLSPMETLHRPPCPSFSPSSNLLLSLWLR